MSSWQLQILPWQLVDSWINWITHQVTQVNYIFDNYSYLKYETRGVYFCRICILVFAYLLPSPTFTLNMEQICKTSMLWKQSFGYGNNFSCFSYWKGVAYIEKVWVNVIFQFSAYWFFEHRLFCISLAVVFLFPWVLCFFVADTFLFFP